MKKNTYTDDTIELKELFFSLITQWKLIALCIFLSLIAALLYLRVTPDTYAVDALVQVEDKKGTSTALLGELSSKIDQQPPAQQSPAQAEIEILKSRLILGSVIDHLNLDMRIASTEDTWSNRLFQPRTYQTEYQPQYVRFKDADKSFEIRQFDIPADYLDKKLLLKFQGQSFNLTNPETNEVLLQGAVNQSVQATAPTGLWKVAIFSQDQPNSTYSLQKLSPVAAIKQLLAHYSVEEKGGDKASGILKLSYQGEDKKNITTVLNTILTTYSQQNIERRSVETAKTLKFLEEQLPDLKQQLDDAERTFNLFRQQYNTVDITKESELYLNQSIALETKKAELEQQRAEMAAKYTAAHPAMREINAQLSAINEKLNQLNATLKRLPDLQRQYLQLYREVEVKQQLYTTLLNSYQQLRIAKAGEIGNAQIVDTAIEPIEPIKPKKLLVLAVAIFLSAFLGTLLVLVRHLLRSSIKDASQIENKLDLPVYATVPHSSMQQSNPKRLLAQNKTLPLLTIQQPDDIAIESLRNMRTTIHFALSQARNNIITLSCPTPKVDKSFISANLAVILAQGGKRVLIIDGDMRCGYLHKYFNCEPEMGLAEYLNGQQTIENIVRTTDIAHLSIITRGKSPVNPSELLITARFKEMLQQLSSQYDHILIDTPPILAVTDGVIVSQYAGVNLIVARHAKTKMKELELTLNRFEQAGAKVTGFILNDFQRNAGSSYGYNYAYTYKMAKDN